MYPWSVEFHPRLSIILRFARVMGVPSTVTILLRSAFVKHFPYLVESHINSSTLVVRLQLPSPFKGQHTWSRTSFASASLPNSPVRISGSPRYKPQIIFVMVLRFELNIFSIIIIRRYFNFRERVFDFVWFPLNINITPLTSLWILNYRNLLIMHQTWPRSLLQLYTFLHISTICNFLSINSYCSASIPFFAIWLFL